MFKKFKVLKITLCCVLALILALCTFLLIWFYGDGYPDFEEFENEFSIENALDDGAIPQGLGNYNSHFFVSTYMNDGSASRIYVVNSEGKSVGYVTMRMPAKEGETEGSLYTGHAGGVAANNTYLWVGSGNTVYTMNRADVVKAAEENGEVNVSAKFTVDCSASFLYYKSSSLYVGEFYKAGDYDTDESHHFTTPSGDNQKAVFYCFDTDNSTKTGLKDLQPEHAVSIPDKIQGMAIVGDKVVLSQSWGLTKSHLLVYKFNYTQNPVLNANGNAVYLDVKIGSSQKTCSVPVYALDSSKEVNDYVIPAMSEGLCSNTQSGKVYVLFENASVKYNLFTREKLTDVYSFIPEEKDTEN